MQGVFVATAEMVTRLLRGEDVCFVLDALRPEGAPIKGSGSSGPSSFALEIFDCKRSNLVGTLSLFGKRQQLEIRELDGVCTQIQVVDYLEALVRNCHPERITVVVLDNAPCKQLMKHLTDQEARGLYLRCLPAYCPQLNLIEGI